MSVDVVYQGLTIARGVATRAQEQDLFIEMEGPMPVATRLLVLSSEAGGERMEARVQRVVEGVGAGMVVAPVTGALPAWLRHLKPPVVRTVEIEADSEFDDAPVTQVSPPPAPPRIEVAPPKVEAPPAKVETAPAPKVVPTGMLVEKTGEIVVPQEVQVVPLAAAPSTESSPPPYEATLEMAVPADDDAKDEGERKSSARPSQKKRSSKRR